MPKTKAMQPKTTTKHLSTSGLIALLLVVATVGVVLSFVFSRQLVGDILFNNKVISAKNEVNTTLKQNLDAVPELKTNYQRLQQDGPSTSEILEALPITEDFGQFSATMEALSARAGVQLLGITLEGTNIAAEGVEPLVAVSGPQPVNYRLSMTGSYDKLVTVVKNLQLNNRPIRIQGISFSGEEPKILAEISITTYYQGLTEIGDVTETLQ